ncbi:hypothetical protein FH972_024957 [Carpinus fangiana]|uniref:Uncharacterized protein n=1 Tax=Carpinus fangiana TaxID=176857 RepID=A0A5N6KZV7_9ROSI|nr:hypothetical protein FH972_024957 [Carpinus fangiana]
MGARRWGGSRRGSRGCRGMQGCFTCGGWRGSWRKRRKRGMVRVESGMRAKVGRYERASWESELAERRVGCSGGDEVGERRGVVGERKRIKSHRRRNHWDSSQRNVKNYKSR